MLINSLIGSSDIRPTSCRLQYERLSTRTRVGSQVKGKVQVSSVRYVRYPEKPQAVKDSTAATQVSKVHDRACIKLVGLLTSTVSGSSALHLGLKNALSDADMPAYLSTYLNR